MIYYTIVECDEYKAWLSNQTEKAITQIEDRLDNVQFRGHFGDHRPIDGAFSLWSLDGEMADAYTLPIFQERKL